MLGEAIPKDDISREKTVLINILLDIELADLFRVASRCSGITEKRMLCYIHNIMFDLIKHGDSCLVSPLLWCPSRDMKSSQRRCSSHCKQNAPLAD